MTELGHFGGGGYFAPDFWSKIGHFLVYFGQRRRVSATLGTSIARFKAINGLKIKSTVPQVLFLARYAPPETQIFMILTPILGLNRDQNLENLGFRMSITVRKWYLG